MQQSSIYKELEAKIEKNSQVKSAAEFDKHLSQLKKDGQITSQEYRSLLELFMGKNSKIN